MVTSPAAAAASEGLHEQLRIIVSLENTLGHSRFCVTLGKGSAGQDAASWWPAGAGVSRALLQVDSTDAATSLSLPSLQH